MEIKELILRIPGLTKEEAEKLGKQVAQGVSGEVAGIEIEGYIGDLELQINISNEMSIDELARKIINGIALKLSGMSALTISEEGNTKK